MAPMPKNASTASAMLHANSFCESPADDVTMNCTRDNRERRHRAVDRTVHEVPQIALRRLSRQPSRNGIVSVSGQKLGRRRRGVSQHVVVSLWSAPA